jgi:ABC-2 type transport system permease protein
MWLLRSSPLDLRALLWSKYWTGTVPLLALALLITVFTNVLLRATGFMMAVSVGTIVVLTLAIGALALGFGALFPQFETENAAQIPTSFGGLVFMMTTVGLLALVIVMEAAPVYQYLQAASRQEDVRVGWSMIAAFAAVLLVCALATVLPLRIGLKRMEEFEF